jgi:hypothetical protein
LLRPDKRPVPVPGCRDSAAHEAFAAMKKPADVQEPETEDGAEARATGVAAKTAGRDTDQAVAEREPAGDDDYVPV